MVCITPRQVGGSLDKSECSGSLKKVKAIQLILLGLLLLMPGHAQFAERIKEEAEGCAKALLTGNYERVVDLTHPRVVKASGGRQKMIETLRNGLAELRRDGFDFHKVTFGKALNPMKAGNSLVSRIPQTVVMKTPSGQLQRQTSLMALSEDGGKTWFFADLGQITKKQFGEFFPELDLVEDLMFPN